MFGLIALVDTISAVLTGGTSILVGQLELIVISLCLLVGGRFVIALGPKVYGVFLLGCFMTSFRYVPVLITVTASAGASAAYGLEPKAYSEIIVSLVVTSLTLSAGLGSTFLGGMLGDAIGLRGTFGMCGSVLPVAVNLPRGHAPGRHRQAARTDGARRVRGRAAEAPCG